MAKILSPTPKLQWIDENGNPLAGGKVNTYVAGTVTPLATYSNSTGTANTNPVILDSSGLASIWLTPGAVYDFVVTDADDVPVYTQEDIATPADLTGDNTWEGNQTFEGNLEFDGTGLRITGDMTNTPAADRLSVQTSIAASTTEFQILPSAGGAESAVSVFTDPDVIAGQYARLACASGVEAILEVGKLGASSYVPFVLNVGGADRVTVSTGGVVTVGNPVAFSVNRAASNFNVAHDTNTAIDFTAEAFDTNGSFDLTTNRFTPPAGYYQLSATVTCLGAVDGGTMTCILYKNGAAWRNGSRPSMASASTVTASSLSTTEAANGTDYFELYAYQGNGSSSTLSFAGDLIQLVFSGHKVG